MRAHLSFAAVSFAALTAAATPAAPQALGNAGGGAGSLTGKTCQGVFESGRRHDWSDGAAELVFAGDGGRLTAQSSQLLGAAAHDPAEYAMVNNRPIDTSRYEHLGPVRDLVVRGDQIRFTDATGARFALTYKNDALSGQRDPRGGSDPRMTRVNLVRMRCR